jgi:hypothetical protein
MFSFLLSFSKVSSAAKSLSARRVVVKRLDRLPHGSWDDPASAEVMNEVLKGRKWTIKESNRTGRILCRFSFLEEKV